MVTREPAAPSAPTARTRAPRSADGSGPHRPLLGLALLALLSLAACRSPAADEDAGACPAGDGWESTGCFDLAGEVVDAAGRPLAEVAVQAFPARDIFGLVTARTDAAGRFQLRAVRRQRFAGAVPAPDTLSVRVVASDPMGAPPPGVAWPRDSAVVRVTVSAPGTKPVAESVRLRLPVP